MFAKQANTWIDPGLLYTLALGLKRMSLHANLSISAYIEPCGFHICRRWAVTELCLHQQHALFLAALEIFLLSQHKTTRMNITSGFVLSCRLVTVVVIGPAVVLRAHDE